ncbi:MAG TPA: hypothetical protein PK191_09050 [Niabella sp.]|nr:hypothetical protein [Niabella sp.]HOZ97975.1 hypothetical protein [Niabella sp.]HQX19539.1 hypothetical protein [Niabella sp.]HRB08020.1 hypothetical protein [Niabella sp.]HRB48183.1 hypothetical protein [Niabella sp.]
MRFKILTIPEFDKKLMRLVRKYPSFKTEYIKLLDGLEENPVQDIHSATTATKYVWLLHLKAKVVAHSLLPI